jgi:hypothetical protein
MLKLKEQVLDEILLRRTKLSRADDIQVGKAKGMSE